MFFEYMSMVPWKNIRVGHSPHNPKIITIPSDFINDNFTIKRDTDVFTIKVDSGVLIVTRIDKDSEWGMDLHIDLKTHVYPAYEKMIIKEQTPYDYSNKNFDHFMLSKDQDKNKIKQQIQTIKPLETPTALIQLTLCIGICIKNCAAYIPRNCKILEQICKLYKTSYILIYEGNSKDNSASMIDRYSKLNPHVFILHETTNENIYPRTVRLARGRNILLDCVRTLNCDHYMVMDFDDVISKLTPEKVQVALQTVPEWDMISANQYGNYYDIWALRTYNRWMQVDCWNTSSVFKKPGLVRQWVLNATKKFSNDENMKVISAFGGTAVYKIQSLKDCVYYGYRNNTECCEHVHLHKQMIEKHNANIYILGQFINH